MKEREIQKGKEDKREIVKSLHYLSFISTGGPRPSCGPRSSFGGPPVFFVFAKKFHFRHKFHKNEKNQLYYLQKHQETTK